MRNSWTAALTAIACGFATALFAQTAQPAQTAAAKTVMVTGCIQRAVRAPVGTSGTVDEAHPPKEATFMLTNAATGPLGTVGTSGSTRTASTEYRLDGDDAKFTPHIGHKVEVTGVVDQGSTTAPSAAASGRATAAPPKLTVDTVRMVSLTCP